MKNEPQNAIQFLGELESLSSKMELENSELLRIQEVLGKLTSLFSNVFDELPVLIWRTDVDGKYNYFNNTWLRFTGRELSQEVDNSWIEGIHREDLAYSQETYEQAFTQQMIFEREYRLRQYDGEYGWIKELGGPYTDFKGVFSGYVGIGFDITERKKVEENSHLNERKFRLLFENSSDGHILIDKEKVIDCNMVAVKMLGYSTKEEVLEHAPLTLFFERQLNGWDVRKRIIRFLEMTVWEEKHQFECEIYTLDGDTLPVEVIISSFPLETTKGIHITLRNITERRAAANIIKHLAHYDKLTGLPNRSLFLESLDGALSKAVRDNKVVAVLSLDLDGFRKINESLGLEAGDQLLNKVAKRLLNSLRKSDTLARMGEDEFMILLMEIKEERDAANVARRLLKVVQQPWKLGIYNLHLTTSIGISIYPHDGDNAEILLTNDNIAMNRIKKENNNDYRFYDKSMNDRVLERMTLENDLRYAVANKELAVFYQPIVDLSTGKIKELEALLRWRHPTRGFVSPAEFIPIAEQSKLIVPVGEWVLQHVCAQNKAWQEVAIPPVCVAVNISARQFEGENLYETISRVLQQTKLDPVYLEMEITESIAMQDAEKVIKILNEIKSAGVNVAVDDFGTGHSSFEYLKRFPIDRIKIDKCFVDGMTSEEYDLAIISTIIQLGKKLGLRVCAEGVETKEQLNLLRSLNCDDAQGYLLSKPLPCDKIEKILLDESYFDWILE